VGCKQWVVNTGWKWWALDSGHGALDSGQWTVSRGQQAVNSGQAVDSGQWGGSEQLALDSGQREGQPSTGLQFREILHCLRNQNFVKFHEISSLFREISLATLVLANVHMY
jgi:hypothetical protein